MGACLDNIGTYVEKLRDYDLSLCSVKMGPTITIAGLSGAGKSTISDSLVNLLRCNVRNAGDGYRVRAAALGIHVKEYSKNHPLEVDIEIDKETLSLAKEGNIVITGRLSGFVAGTHADVKMFVRCDLDERIGRVYAKEILEGKNVTIADVGSAIVERDEADIKTYLDPRLYEIDANSCMGIYDIIIDTTKMDREKTAERAIHDVLKVLKTKNWEVPFFL